MKKVRVYVSPAKARMLKEEAYLNSFISFLQAKKKAIERKIARLKKKHGKPQ